MKSVCIIGKGAGWELAPPTSEAECWGITQLNLRRPVNRVIDMNDYSLWGEKEASEAKESRRLAQENGIPYIDLDEYPLEIIIDAFKTDYFNSTVDYAIALAIYEDYEKIDFYGVNMANLTEYSYQKPGVEFWIGIAKGRGTEVNVHGSMSTILKTGDGLLYGYGIKQKGNLWLSD